MDVVYAMSIFCDLYELIPAGDYDTNIEWKDSILTDTDTELEQKLSLQNAGILGKAEIRAWYTGESIESAQAEIDKIDSASQNKMLNDIFSGMNTESNLDSDEPRQQQAVGDIDEELKNKGANNQ